MPREDEIEQVEVTEELCRSYARKPVSWSKQPEPVPASDTAASESVYAGEDQYWFGKQSNLTVGRYYALKSGIPADKIPTLAEISPSELGGVDPGEHEYF